MYSSCLWRVFSSAIELKAPVIISNSGVKLSVSVSISVDECRAVAVVPVLDDAVRREMLLGWRDGDHASTPAYPPVVDARE